MRNRKGQFKPLIEQAQRRGYTRLRVDGALLDLAEPINLRKSKRHDIDLAVDRIRLKEGVESRLLSSIQAALEMAEGACLVEIDAGGASQSIHFSENLACTDCGLAFPELSPQSFSFNSPVGACPDCQGLGISKAMSRDLVCPDLSLSLAEGAIVAWQWPQKKNPLPIEDEIMQGLAETLGFELDQALSELSPHQLDALFNGTKKSITVKWRRRGRTGSYEAPFVGVLPHLMKLYESSSREAVKAALEPFIDVRPCAACGGARLRPASRAVKVGGSSIDALARAPIDQALSFFEGLNFEGQLARVGEEIIPEITNRLRFLLEVGLDYLALDRPGPTLSGGESQRMRLATQLGSGLTSVTYILDEPSIGLHPRDQDRLIHTLQALRDRGNTIIVVEHDEATMRAADCLVDFWPGGGAQRR